MLGRRKLPPEYLGEYRNKLTLKQMARYRRSPISSGHAQHTEPLEAWETAASSAESLAASHSALLGRYQELLPHRLEPQYRNRMVESLVRREQMRRRRHLTIPEFYVGSLVAVTIADPHAPEGCTRFMGLCTLRLNMGLWTEFTIRNVVDNVVVDIKYELYNPTIQKIEVIKLERRLDDNLLYLSDAPREFSQFAQDMTPVPHPKDAPVPLNKLQVPLLPPPWRVQWHLFGYRGIQEDSMLPHLSEVELTTLEPRSQLWQRYDLAAQHYRRPSGADEADVFQDVQLHHQDLLRYQEERRLQEEALFRKKLQEKQSTG